MKLRLSPWFTDSATRFLNNLFKWLPATVRPERPITVLEWGGGNSTLWLLQKGCRVLTVESNPSFIGKLHGITSSLGLRASVKTSASEALAEFNAHDCIVLQADSFGDVGCGLFDFTGWDFIINDGIDRLRVLEAITSYAGSPVVVLDNSEYCANWGKLERCSAHPDRVKAYREFLRNPEWKNIVFEQEEGRDGHAVADHCGWEAPHRWATSILWPKDHVLAKMIVTTLGLPLVNLDGADDSDLKSLPQRCRFDWDKMQWLDKEFTKTLNLRRSYE